MTSFHIKPSFDMKTGNIIRISVAEFSNPPKFVTFVQNSTASVGESYVL